MTKTIFCNRIFCESYNLDTFRGIPYPFLTSGILKARLFWIQASAYRESTVLRITISFRLFGYKIENFGSPQGMNIAPLSLNGKERSKLTTVGLNPTESQSRCIRTVAWDAVEGGISRRDYEVLTSYNFLLKKRITVNSSMAPYRRLLRYQRRQ